MTAPKRIGVMIATPLRTFKSMADLPKNVGRALNELRLRGLPRGLCKTTEDVASWGSFQTGDDVSAANFREQADKYVFEFAAAAGGLCRARNEMTYEFLYKSTHEFILWQDADLTKKPGDECGSLADAWLRLLSHRQPIVGAIYCKRTPKPQWAVSWIAAAELQPSGNGLLQVAELAMGCKCYHRKVFTEIARIYPQLKYRDRDSGGTRTGYFQNLVSSNELLSEDYYFDAICRVAKIAILADTKLKLRHEDEDGTFYPPGDFPPIPAVDKANA